MRRPLLTIDQILAWVDDFHATTKRWPKRTDGRIPCSLGETWQAIEMALKNNGRGLSYRSSLAKLLQEHRGVVHRLCRPRLSEKLILQWADDHFTTKGEWPGAKSGRLLTIHMNGGPRLIVR